MRSFLVAIQFLTRLPVPGGNDLPPPEVFRRSVRYLPLVGGLIGGFSAAIIWGASHLWVLPLAVLLALALEAWITGAFHEDAVADFFDAFGGGYTKERVLEILRDSRIGAYGSVAIILALAIRGGALMALAMPTLAAALVASATLGRLMILPAMVLLPPLQGRESIAKDAGQGATWSDVVVAVVVSVPGVAWYAWLQPLRLAIAATALALTMFLFLRVVRRRLGGITGDCLGCLCYLSQLVVLLTACAKVPSW
jgi:adenosylcobinamide-GDP ribazoletransferase